MHTAATLEVQLRSAFPERAVSGTIAPHECDECNALREHLAATTWSKVASEFIRSNEDVLTLLSPEAYVAFLPAWLNEAVRNPSGEVADMLLVNLGHEPQTTGFTVEQSLVIVEVARFVATTNYWGAEDLGNVESLAAIEAAWLPSARRAK